MKRFYFFLARAMVVLIVLITALFTVRVIQTVQAESQFTGGSTSGVSDINLAYPATFTLQVNITGTGTGSEVVVSSPKGTDGKGIDCGTDCTAVFAANSTVKLVAGVDNPDVVFVQWIINGELGPTGSLLTLTMDGPKTVFAVFNYKSSPKNYLTVSRVGTTGGKVTSTPAGIDCGVTCGALYDPGTEIALTAEPGIGEMLEKWMVNGVDAGYGTTLNLKMDQNQNVLAVFGPFKYRLNVNKTGNGSVKSSPAGIDCGTICQNALYLPGASVELTATAGTGSQFQYWDMGSGQVTDNPLTVAMDADKTISAVFTGSNVDLVVALSGGKNATSLMFDYTITVTNKASDTAVGAAISDSTEKGANASWTCTASVGATCDASGIGPLTDTVTIPKDGVLTYTVHRAWYLGAYTYTVTATAPSGTGEITPADNSKSLTGTFIDLPVLSKQ